MNNCSHENETGKYCSQCAKSINAVMREPGEIKSMRNYIKDTLTSSDIEHKYIIMCLAQFLFMDVTLQWVLGEVNDDVLNKIVRSTLDKKKIY